jgi:hypothetical protein
MEKKNPDPSGIHPNPQGENQETGLPWLRTWRGIYLLVLGSFLLWVALLYTLSVSFS